MSSLATAPVSPSPSDSEGIDAARAFHIEQFKALRVEIDESTKEIRAVQRYVAAAVGGIWAWLATHSVKLPWWAWWMPVVLVALGFIQCAMLLREVRRLGTYIRTVENALRLSDLVTRGWETYLFEEYSHNPMASVSVHLVWLCMAVGTIIAALLSNAR
jgi:hypothetical protein